MRGNSRVHGGRRSSCAKLAKSLEYTEVGGARARNFCEILRIYGCRRGSSIAMQCCMYIKERRVYALAILKKRALFADSKVSNIRRATISERDAAKN